MSVPGRSFPGADHPICDREADAPYEIRIYPGADGRFTIYEDDNETYAYEEGQCARYDLVWDDARRTLTIGARRGSFPGMVPSRQLDIVLVGEAYATAIGPAAPTRSVTYTGKTMTIPFK